MPITNNIVTIGGQALRPAPNFSISYETFKSGEYIIGGLMKITLNGSLYGTSQSDLDTKAKDISSYSATCDSVNISCGTETLASGQGYIKSVSINPTDQPFVVSYSMEIELPSVKRDAAFNSLYDMSISDNINLSKYEESLTLNGDEDLANNFFYVDQRYSEAALKLSGSISIQAYHHACQNFSPDLTNQLHAIAINRLNAILALNSSLSSAHPVLSGYTNSGFSAIHDTKNITINKISNQVDVKFDIYIIKGTCHPTAMTNISITETVDQTTGLSSISVKGSVKGLTSLNADVIGNSKFLNATQTYNDLENKFPSMLYHGDDILGCLSAASAPDSVCYQRISSQITEDFQNGQIDFNLSYGDLESCELGGGTTIDININEDYPALHHVEHIIPGRGVALVQIGGSQTAYKVTITASGKLNSCDTTKLSNLISCVNNRLNAIINDRGYYNGILAKEDITTGKYSYKISRSYIECI